MLFKEIIYKLDMIEIASGANAKKKFMLEMLSEHPEAQDFLKLGYDSTLYGLNKKSFEKIFSYTEDMGKFSDPGLMAKSNSKGKKDVTTEWIKAFFEKASKISGNGRLNFIRDTLKEVMPNHVKWIIRALNKDLRLGVSIKTLNKYFKLLNIPELPVFGVQLCGKFKSIPEVVKKLKFPIAVACKYDGMRAILKRKDGVVTLTSRQGETITYVPELVKYFTENFEHDFEIDGEIDCGDFSLLSSRIGRKAENIVPIENLHFRIYDMLSYGISNYREEAYSVRSKDLRLMFCESKYLKIEERIIAHDEAALTKFNNQMVERKEEGIVIKILNKPYEVDSRKNMFKLKPIFENSFKIYGAEFGSGKYADKIGILLVEDSEGVIKSGVGTGMKDLDKELATRLYEENNLFGRIVDVSYYAITTNNNGGTSLRNPSFLKFRDDKKEADKINLEND